MVFLEKITDFLNRLLVFIAGLFLVGLIVLVCLNIFMRVVWVPVAGTFELVGFFGAVLTAFALGYTQTRRGNVAVDVVFQLFPKRLQRFFTGVNNAVCSLFFLLAAWRLVRWSTVLWKTGELTETLRIVFYPFSYAVALGCAVLALVCFTDFMKSLFPEKESEK